MEAQGLSSSDLVPVLGSEAVAMAMTEGKLEINREQAMALGKVFRVNSTLFLSNGKRK